MQDQTTTPADDTEPGTEANPIGIDIIGDGEDEATSTEETPTTETPAA